jgi:hypothetical protein
LLVIDYLKQLNSKRIQSKGDSWDIDEREEILAVVDLVLRTVETVALLVSEYLNQDGLNCLLLSRSGLDPVDDCAVIAEAHHGFDDQSKHLDVDVELVDLREVG